MRTTKIVPPSAASSRPTAIDDCGLARWWRSVQASYRADRAARALRRQRKLELNPVTATQIWFYRLLVGGTGLAFLCLLMDTPV